MKSFLKTIQRKLKLLRKRPRAWLLEQDGLAERHRQDIDDLLKQFG